ncbi:unnamed protein product [Acanthosepion pharaonis]|uniref:Uncharacterized protein n=1 Tax=Acanthosepion pharaonis TaxID=158019 RepID=A0A812DVH2_ACAPH|nr:unnamed protein product [Sepia pharaonis]
MGWALITERKELKDQINQTQDREEKQELQTRYWEKNRKVLFLPSFLLSFFLSFFLWSFFLEMLSFFSHFLRLYDICFLLFCSFLSLFVCLFFHSFVSFLRLFIPFFFPSFVHHFTGSFIPSLVRLSNPPFHSSFLPLFISFFVRFFIPSFFLCSFLLSFVCSFLLSFLFSFLHFFLHWFFHPFLHFFIPFFFRLPISSFVRFFLPSFLPSFICASLLSFIRSFVFSSLPSFVRLFIDSFLLSFICSFVHSFLRLFFPSFHRFFLPLFIPFFLRLSLRLFIPLFVWPFLPSFVCSFLCLFVHSLLPSFVPSFFPSFLPSFVYFLLFSFTLLLIIFSNVPRLLFSQTFFFVYPFQHCTVHSFLLLFIPSFSSAFLVKFTFLPSAMFSSFSILLYFPLLVIRLLHSFFFCIFSPNFSFRRRTFYSSFPTHLTLTITPPKFPICLFFFFFSLFPNFSFEPSRILLPSLAAIKCTEVTTLFSVVCRPQAGHFLSASFVRQIKLFHDRRRHQRKFDRLPVSLKIFKHVPQRPYTSLTFYLSPDFFFFFFLSVIHTLVNRVKKEDKSEGGRFILKLERVPKDLPIILSVAHLVLDEILFIREGPQYPGGPVLELVEQSHRLDLPRLIRAIRDENEVRFTVGRVTNVLLDRLADRRLVTAHVGGNLGVSLVSIIVDCLLDGGDELVDRNGRRTNVGGLSFGRKLVLILRRLPLPPNIHVHGPLEH